MDFIVARFNNIYGYISTGKDKAHGFKPSYQEVIQHLESKDKDFTYATPEELAVHDHQREWTQKDRVYYNKLKFFKQKDDVQFVEFLTRGLRDAR